MLKELREVFLLLSCFEGTKTVDSNPPASLENLGKPFDSPFAKVGKIQNKKTLLIKRVLVF